MAPPPRTTGEDMKYAESADVVPGAGGGGRGGGGGVAAPDSPAATAATTGPSTFADHRSSRHPGEHALRCPSSVAYTSDPSGSSAGEALTASVVCAHALGRPVARFSATMRLSCPPKYSTPFCSSIAGVEWRT